MIDATDHLKLIGARASAHTVAWNPELVNHRSCYVNWACGSDYGFCFRFPVGFDVA